MLSRRQFASGTAAIVSGGLIGGRSGMGEAAPFSTLLPIPRLIDAANQGNAVKLKVLSPHIRDEEILDSNKPHVLKKVALIR